ncbi:GIY-YIG nuclease family protein [Candidatus Roizmanbacteria bacterium]|nr:GIY-YIG nuclease family protein [Candidatus Roizmanbacteria bacterium]
MEEKTNSTVPVTRQAINTLQTTAGVYIFRHQEEILYIGKSVNLKARLLSHLENAKADAKEAAIVGLSDSISCIITDSEFHALLLESFLIQKYRPRYNARWKDDKSYLYIKITVADEFPKIVSTRKENDKKSAYFGPFSSTYQVEGVIKALRRVIPFCTQKRLTNHACFYSKIGQCNPCPNTIHGLTDQVLKQDLTRQYRKNIRRVMQILRGKNEAVQKDFLREMKVLVKAKQFEQAIEVRKRLYLLENLNKYSFSNGIDMDRINQSEASVQELQKLLQPYFSNLSKLQRIECFDISNTSQKEATASMVVFTEGLINKKEYRKFKIKNELLQSDFEMMNEVLKRRFRNKWEHPDLLVVDGGKPQVRVAQKVLAELDLSLPLIGIAKHPDRLVLAVQDTPSLRPSLHNLGFNMIRALRDESHRFAKKYHIQLRDKNLLR